MGKLELLNEKNDVEIKSINDEAFKTYGRVLKGYDFSDAISYMEKYTYIPAEGNVYLRTDPKLEGLKIKADLEARFYGGKPCQIGYCNGRNTTYNGFEFHKCSEINVACTDMLMVLGHRWDIVDKHYKNEDAEVFFVEKGTAFEMYQTTLHLSPCRVTDEGFKAIVVLSLDTNTPLNQAEKLVSVDDEESALLLQRNKWVIAHPDREPLIKQGAFAGIIGENKELYY